jgi:hypothetical protein
MYVIECKDIKVRLVAKSQAGVKTLAHQTRARAFGKPLREAAALSTQTSPLPETASPGHPCQKPSVFP